MEATAYGRYPKYKKQKTKDKELNSMQERAVEIKHKNESVTSQNRKR